jgi:hypothetical protein
MNQLVCGGCGDNIEAYVTEDDTAKMVKAGVTLDSFKCEGCKDVEEIGDEEMLDDDEEGSEKK